MRPDAPAPIRRSLWTIPNLMSMFRLVLLPAMFWAYCVKEDNWLTVVLLTISGISDVLDGWVARTFHQISDIGKVLDPVADKLTQAAVLVCLLTRYPWMTIPLVLMAVKEAVRAASGLIVIRKTGVVYGASWHGKVNTCLLYTVMVAHLLWPDLPQGVSQGLTALCVCMMLLSFVLYTRDDVRMLREVAANKQKENPSA